MENTEAGAIMAQATRDGFISAANRDMLAAELGPRGNEAFTGWLQQRGITVRDQSPMDDTDLETEDQMAADEADFSAFPDLKANDPASFMRVYGRELQAYNAAAKSEADARRQAYEQAQRQIESSRFGAPSQSEMLFRISEALSRPSKIGGFKGMLGNVTPVLADSATERRQSDAARAEALAKLQQQYMASSAGTAREAAAERLGAIGKLAPLFKPQAAPKVRTGFNPITGELVNMDTGAPITGGGETPVLSPQQVAQLARDPRNKGMRFRTTDGREMEIK